MIRQRARDGHHVELQPVVRAVDIDCLSGIKADPASSALVPNSGNSGNQGDHLFAATVTFERIGTTCALKFPASAAAMRDAMVLKCGAADRYRGGHSARWSSPERGPASAR